LIFKFDFKTTDEFLSDHPADLNEKGELF